MAYIETCKADGCASLYLMNETSGVFADSIGNKPLTQSGTLTRQQTAFPMYGAGITSDGSTGYADAGSVALTSSDNISMEAWIVLTSLSTPHGAILSNAPSSSANGISFGLNNGGTGLEAGFTGNFFTVLYDGVSWAPSSYQIPTLGLHYLAITRTTGTTTQLYVDGVNVTSVNPGPVPAAPSGASTKVGGYITSSGTAPRVTNYPVGGAGFYPVTLTAAQILNHYKVGLRNGVSY